MYSMEELPLQDLQDFWDLLYTTFCRKICADQPAEGEAVIRRAIAEMGRRQGEWQRQEHEQSGLNTDLRSFFLDGRGAVCDPRAAMTLYARTAEVCLWDRYICPMANYWAAHGAEAYGLFYCEEYMRAFLSGYTGGKGQFHMSKVLTDKRDILCQFSAYFRPANLEPEQRRTAFERAPVQWEEPSGSFSDYIREKAVLLCAFLCAELKQTSGAAGLQSFTGALRAFELESESLLEDIALRRGVRCDQDLLERSFPFSLHEPSALWSSLSADEARALLMKFVASPLAAKYGAAVACAG